MKKVLKYCKICQTYKENRSAYIPGHFIYAFLYDGHIWCFFQDSSYGLICHRNLRWQVRRHDDVSLTVSNWLRRSRSRSSRRRFYHNGIHKHAWKFVLRIVPTAYRARHNNDLWNLRLTASLATMCDITLAISDLTIDINVVIYMFNTLFESFIVNY